MPIPSSVDDLDPAAANNSPGGSEPIGPNLDGYLRAHAAIIRQLYDDLASSEPDKGAAMVGGATRSVATYTAIRTFTGLATRLEVGGRENYLDGGQGTVAVDVADTTSADNDVTIFVDALGRRWKRQGMTEIRSRWSGASYNASAAVNTSALQNCINAAIAAGIKTVRLEGVGRYQVNALTNAGLVVFRGDGAFFDDYKYLVVQDRASEDGEITLPAIYSWFPGKVYRGYGVGLGRTTFDVRKHWTTLGIESGATYYIDPAGSDANSGTLPNQALKTITAALAKADVGRIVAAPGTYFDLGKTFTRTVAVVSQSGAQDVIIRTGYDCSLLTWSSPQANVFKCTPGNAIYRVLDKTKVDAEGDYIDYIERSSQATVAANPGSFWYDSATGELYVRRLTNVSPQGSTDLVILANMQNVQNGAISVFTNGVRFEGGNRVHWVAATSAVLLPSLYAYNSSFRYGGGFGIDADAATVILQECQVSRCALDNLNYHNAFSVPCKVVEINVRSHGAGFTGATAVKPHEQNASSNHDSGVTLRINGEYFRGYGPNVIDTHDINGMSICVGTISRDSRATVPSNYGVDNNTAFYTASSQYLYDCASNNCSADLVVADGATMYASNYKSSCSFNRLGSNSKIQQF